MKGEARTGLVITPVRGSARQIPQRSLVSLGIDKSALPEVDECA